MALADDELVVAAELIALTPRRPRQAELRAAVSLSYYALFHEIVADAAKMLTPSRPKSLRYKVQRQFEHRAMADVCQLSWTGTKPEHFGDWQDCVNLPVSPQLREVGRIFKTLQEARHEADYDLSISLTKASAWVHVREAREALVAWRAVRRTEQAGVFAAMLRNRKLR